MAIDKQEATTVPYREMWRIEPGKLVLLPGTFRVTHEVEISVNNEGGLTLTYGAEYP